MFNVVYLFSKIYSGHTMLIPAANFWVSKSNMQVQLRILCTDIIKCDVYTASEPKNQADVSKKNIY